MITDDPGTPGNGHWENNLAIAFEHRPNEWSIDAPAIDLNYGVGRAHPAHAARRARAAEAQRSRRDRRARRDGSGGEVAFSR